MIVSEALLTALVASVFGSPVLLAIINMVAQARPNKRQLEKIEEISTSLNEFKLEQAIQGLSQINWRTIEKKVVSGYHAEEWFMRYSTLSDIHEEDNWPSKLREETARARKLIQGE